MWGQAIQFSALIQMERSPGLCVWHCTIYKQLKEAYDRKEALARWALISDCRKMKWREISAGNFILSIIGFSVCFSV